VSGGLADRQAALVAALTAGAPVPPGFDARLVGVARTALLRKRAGEVSRHWPELAAATSGWAAEFGRWAATRPTVGAFRDGWDLARELAARGSLPAPAADELAAREAGWHYDGRSAPRPRRTPALRRAGGSVALQVAGRIRLLRRARP
jgi:hypothetical protein